MKKGAIIKIFRSVTYWLLSVIERHKYISWLLLALAATAIFAFRNIPAFTIPNFYAEDATIIFENVYTKNIFATFLTGFNGYLIVGLYAVAYIAAAANELVGGDLSTLPSVTAIISCLFLGFAASLPFLLFRKQLGTPLALLVVVLTAFVPIAAYDYAIIGTIGNLKFAFLYVATLLVVYRLINPGLGRARTAVIDGLLLLCALTNVTVAFLLPVLLLPQVFEVVSHFRKNRSFGVNVSFGVVSAAVLAVLGVAYVAVALLKGIPKIPGYLDAPFNPDATLPIAERSTFFAFTHPITPSFNSYFVAALMVVGLLLLGLYLKRHMSDRYVVFAMLWGIFLGSVLFVINRPGIGDLYLNYLHKGGPDQFFMAQNMIFIFLLAWLVRRWVRSRTFEQAVLISAGVVLYMLLAFPLSTSFGQNSEVYYKSMQPIEPNLEKACRQYANQEDVIVQVYPSPYWQWVVDRDLACE